MRIPYVPNPPNFTSPEDVAITERVKTRRGDRGLIPLDLALLHAPPVADGWNSLLGAIRTSTTLEPSIRETAICRIAVLNRAWYEFEHHAPLITNMPIAGIKNIITAPPYTTRAANEAIDGIDAKHAATLLYTDYMTLAVEVPDDVFALVGALFGEREVVELTATVAAYNCVSRFLVALNVNERNGGEGMRLALGNVSQELIGLEPAPR